MNIDTLVLLLIFRLCPTIFNLLDFFPISAWFQPGFQFQPGFFSNFSNVSEMFIFNHETLIKIKTFSESINVLTH